ncbi:hypothetical protein IWQ61_004967 [Dispira simplex]|nr:hypothetical protein IWQ61_004967 [Dispira simplex]
MLRKRNISLDIVIKKLKELKTHATSLMELSEKPSEEHGDLAEKQELDEVWDNYCKENDDILSMLPVEREQRPRLIDRVYAAITSFYNSYLNRLKWDVESIQHVHADLEEVNANYMAGPVIWVPFSNLNDPVRRFLVFPLIPTGRTIIEGGLGKILGETLWSLEMELESNPILKEFTFTAYEIMFYILLLDITIHKGTTEAHNFVREICDDPIHEQMRQPYLCDKDLGGFIDSVAEEDLDKRKKMKYPDPLSISGIEYAKFEFKDNTDEKNGFLL